MTARGPAVAGVLLAAGRSTRLGQPKPLAPLGGEALVRHAARSLAGGGYATLLAVLPPGEVGPQIRAALGDWPFAFTVNPDPARGLLSSFQAGLLALPPGTDAAAFALADMPRVPATHHAALLRAFAGGAAGERPPLVLTEYAAPEGPNSEGPVRAPPLLVRADLWPELLALPDADHGPQALLRRYGCEAVTVGLEAGALLDLDTPEALAAAQAGWSLHGG